jgi:hypothetical protein
MDAEPLTILTNTFNMKALTTSWAMHGRRTAWCEMRNTFVLLWCSAVRTGTRWGCTLMCRLSCFCLSLRVCGKYMSCMLSWRLRVHARKTRRNSRKYEGVGLLLIVQELCMESTMLRNQGVDGWTEVLLLWLMLLQRHLLGSRLPLPGKRGQSISRLNLLWY